MPSGQTHDRITLWSLPIVAGLSFGQTQNGNLTLLVSGGFLFGGLMFGPDLDIYSRQYQRWGWLRWIWLPYQKSLRHRGFLSHGPIIGTALRSLYLSGWIALLAGVGLVVAHWVGGMAWDWRDLAKEAIASQTSRYAEWFALFIGLELGAMSHYLSDWVGSAWKRFTKGKVKAVKSKLPGTAKGKRLASQRVLKKRTAKTHRRDSGFPQGRARR